VNRKGDTQPGCDTIGGESTFQELLMSEYKVSCVVMARSGGSVRDVSA